MTAVDLSEISRSIQVWHIAVPLARAVGARPDERLGPVSDRLRADQFTYAPVIEGKMPVGLVTQSTERPRASVRSVMRPLDGSLLISSDTSLRDLPAALRDEPFLFVLQGRRLTSFVTPADMGAAPARTYYYLLLSQLEILLADLVRRSFPDQSTALAELAADRRSHCEELLKELRARDEALDPVAAMGLVDLITIAKTIPRFAMAATRTGRSWNWLQSSVGDFRNDVMHPVRDFARATQSGMRSLAKFDERVRLLTDAAQEALDAEPGEPA